MNQPRGYNLDINSSNVRLSGRINHLFLVFLIVV